MQGHILKVHVWLDVTSHLHFWQNDRDLLRAAAVTGGIVHELCESRGGRPGLSVLTSLLVSVDVKLY